MIDNAARHRADPAAATGDAVLLGAGDQSGHLTGLIARHGAHRIELDVLPSHDASILLRTLINPRIEAALPVLEALAEQCARLPLALRIAAELAMSRPVAQLSNLVDELATTPRRLDLLAAGDDPRTALREVFSWSYLQLPAAAARAFRYLGLHPGSDLTPHAAAALAEVSVLEGQQLLSQLDRAHLVEQDQPGRYRLHRLLLDYASELNQREDSARDRWMAQTRLYDHYLYTAARAMDLLFPTRSHQRPELPPGCVETGWLTDPAAARQWLDAERANLVAVAEQAGRKGWPWHTIRLAQLVAHHLDSGGHQADALRIHRGALAAAKACDDQLAEAISLNAIGTACSRLGLAEDISSFQRALAIYLELGDRAGQGRVLGNLGHVYRRLGRYPEALDHYRRHLEIHQATGDEVEQSTALMSVGELHFSLGNYAESVQPYRQSLAICQQSGDIEGQALALDALAAVQIRLGNYTAAIADQQLALQKYRESGDQDRAAQTLASLAGTTEREARSVRALDLPQAAGD